MVFEMEVIAGDDIGRVCTKLYGTVIDKKETGYLRFNGFTVMICHDVINYSEDVGIYKDGSELRAKEDIKYGDYGIIIRKGEQTVVYDQCKDSKSFGVRIENKGALFYFSYQDVRLLFERVK